MEVQLVGHKDELVVTIDDDGVGFDPSKNTAIDSKGIFNMKLRVELLGGSFEISSAANIGTHIIVSVPLNDYHF
ncbi:MAG: hypothetical protein HC906_16345 [Bacteroidales bacterium]|nr:hypothetical protein [Bacteroidales bacterium]